MKERRIFSREYKLAAVKKVLETRLTYCQVARLLGIRDNLIHRWKQPLGRARGVLTLLSNSIEIKRIQTLASSRKMDGDFVGALSARQTLEALHDENSVFPNDRVQNLTQLANLAVHVRDLKEAERSARKSVALSLSLPKETQATCLMLLSCVLAESEKFEEAALHAERAIEIFESVIGAESDFVVYRKRDLKRMRARSLGGYLDL